jgi:DNA-binding transcriptional regulator GbsR (MarR family)
MTEISVMTEITETTRLPAAVSRFILHWGDMGGQWGVNRSVSQIHALLYLSERPLTADDIAETLGLARSNVSNSIRELLGWNLIRRVPIMGDRREHFEAETDIWEIASRIAAGRKEREIDPVLAALKACVAEARGGPPHPPRPPPPPPLHIRRAGGRSSWCRPPRDELDFCAGRRLRIFWR